MKYDVTLGAASAQVEVVRKDGQLLARVEGGEWKPVNLRSEGDAAHVAQVGHRKLAIKRNDDRVFVLDGATPLVGTAVDPRSAALALGAGGNQGHIVTQMPGAIVRVLVSEGEEVAEGQVLLVVEAMKMENEFRAPISGQVTQIHVTAGLAVESGTLLAVVTPAEA